MTDYTFTSAERKELMQLMRAFHIPDAVIGQAWGITRQQVHNLLGRSPRPDKPAKLNGKNARRDLPAELLAWRTRRGLSQEQAAPLLGIARGGTTVSDYERGKKVCAFADALLKLMDMMDRYEPSA